MLHTTLVTTTGHRQQTGTTDVGAPCLPCSESCQRSAAGAGETGAKPWWPTPVNDRERASAGWQTAANVPEWGRTETDGMPQAVAATPALRSDRQRPARQWCGCG